MQWGADRWPVVPGGTMGIHQWTGADGRHIWYASCSKGQAEHSHSPQGGQHTVLIPCDQDRGHTVYHTYTYRSGFPVVGLVATLADDFLSVTLSRVGEPNGRPRIQAKQKLHKEVFNRTYACLELCKVDLFTTSLNHQLDKYASWRPDPGAMMTNVFHIS